MTSEQKQKSPWLRRSGPLIAAMFSILAFRRWSQNGETVDLVGGIVLGAVAIVVSVLVIRDTQRRHSHSDSQPSEP
jgi:hypothetical protein